MNIKNSKILVSIIVPIYNIEKYLERCIESLIKQTHKNIEIWLIDDGSTDNSRKICDEWMDNDSRINVIHKKNGGVSSARNVGLDNCKGEYVVFVDADDYVKENYIEVLLNSAVENNCEMAIVNFIEKYSDGREKKVGYTTKSKLLNRKEFLDNLCNKNSYKSGPFNKIFLRKIIVENNILFDENVFYGEDLFFIVEFSQKIERFFYEYDEHLYYYYCREGSATRTTFNYRTASYINICEPLIDIFQKNGAESSMIKNKYIVFYFFSLYCSKDVKNYSKIEYKKICKKYYLDVLKSKKISIIEKMTLLGVVFFPNVMKFIKEIKLVIKNKVNN